jgi:hypothetical protein
MTPSRAWLPGLDPSHNPEVRHEGQTAAGATFRVPALTGPEAAAVADHVRHAALAARHTHGIYDVVAAISRAALRLANPDDPIGARAVAALEAAGGWPPRTAEELLASHAIGWTEDSLMSILRGELRDPALLDGPQPDGGSAGRRRQAIGPPALFLVLAGNVPGIAVTAVLRGLLVRSAVLCKLPQDEPDLVGLFARALDEEDPALAATIAATWWPADRPSPAADEWTKRCGKVIVYGGADAISSLRARTPPETPLVEYGPRLGMACLGPNVSDDELAALARDVCAYDQAGCVSPRLVYLLGEFLDHETADILKRLATALGSEVLRSPGSPLRDTEAVAVRSTRARYQFGGEDDAQAFGAADLSWTLLYRGTPSAYSESLPRLLWAYRAVTMNDLRGLSSVLEGRVQAMGVAGLDVETQDAVERLAVEWGVSRVVQVGEMAWPPADWRHDGRFQLLPLLRFTEFE